MIEIIPAIIPESFDDLKEKLSEVVGQVRLVQVDINDGKFTEYKSWPYIVSDDPTFTKIIREEAGLPFWEDLEYEFHLMVSDPVTEANKWVSAGAKRVMFHVESFVDVNKAQEFVNNFKSTFTSGLAISPELGVVISMNTQVEVIEPLIPIVDCVQIMSIDHIGAQGEEFDKSVYEKVKALRLKDPNIPIAVDGGVDLDNAKELISAGADRLVIGSAIFDSDDIAGTIKEFRQITQI